MALQNTIEALEQEQLATVRKLVKPLEIQKIRSADYVKAVEYFGIGLGSPILLPLGIALGFFGFPQQSKVETFRQVCCYSPFGLSNGFYELNKGRPYMKMHDPEAITTENDGTLPAISVAKEFNTKNNGNLVSRFNRLDITLPSGHNWFMTYGKCEPYFSDGIEVRRAPIDRSTYNSSNYFLKADPVVQSKLVALIEEEKVLKRKI